MTDLELDVWDAWLRERQDQLEETLIMGEMGAET